MLSVTSLHLHTPPTFWGCAGSVPCIIRICANELPLRRFVTPLDAAAAAYPETACRGLSTDASAAACCAYFGQAMSSIGVIIFFSIMNLPGEVVVLLSVPLYSLLVVLRVWAARRDRACNMSPTAEVLRLARDFAELSAESAATAVALLIFTALYQVRSVQSIRSADRPVALVVLERSIHFFMRRST